MTALDTNILVSAHRMESPWHGEAAKCVRDLAEGSRSWAIPWPCIHEFIGCVPHPGIFRPPTPLRKALDDLEIWMESPSLRLIGEPQRYWPVLRDTLVAGAVAGPVVHDGRVAAICLAHGVTVLYSADRDFSRFPALPVRNPLTPPGSKRQ